MPEGQSQYRFQLHFCLTLLKALTQPLSVNIELAVISVIKKM